MLLVLLSDNSMHLPRSHQNNIFPINGFVSSELIMGYIILPVENLEVSRPDISLRPIDKFPALRVLQGEDIKNEVEIVHTPAH
jgi:hypothetical protein